MPRPRRLLTFGHSYTVTLNRCLAQEMSQAGRGAWEVTAAAPVYFRGYQDLRPTRLCSSPQELCPPVPLPAYLTRLIHVFFYGRKLRSLLQGPWDLVHCWEEPYILAGAQAAYWLPRQTPLVYRTAQSLIKRYPWPFRQFEHYAMTRAVGWVCSGVQVAKALGSQPLYAARPMRLIPLGVDTEAFRPDPAAGVATRRELGWDDGGPPVVGFLGRFVPEKGLGLLTRVLDGLAAPWRALLVGAGPLERPLRAWAARHPGRARVLTGVRHDDVPRHLAAMDLLCAPSQTAPHWREQFGRMLIEAFASGLAVVGSDSGEIPHVVGDAGLVVGEADEAGWGAAVAGLLADPGRRAELGRRGRARARERFAWPVIARQHLDFFEKLVACRAV
jgi:glycosyltransferase involved in cell wall biosynthesis